MLKETGFHPIIRQWFEKNFDKPSPPQVLGWPAIARDEHTLICAPTGSGKTLAAFLWSVDKIFRSRLDNGSALNTSVHTLYISPLKALNNDIQRNLEFPLNGIREEALSQGLPDPEISAQVRTGDTPGDVRQKMLKKPPDILITTPESLYLLLTNTRGRMLFHDLRYIIIDEIHALCSSKRGVHLSLSVERLMKVCGKEPVRIGLSATQRPLEKVARYLGGQTTTIDDDGEPVLTPRPVTIIDTGQRKDMDLMVISPVENFSDLPEATVWPAVYKMLYDLIGQHNTTLIFAPMRAQTEKIARELNVIHQRKVQDDKAVVALAHHGSMSREMRYDIEARLKQGKIPAVVATASLELGIDIGSIDLVIQLESPKSVSAGLQRIGRSGHLLSATSKGRIIPLYPSDLDDCLTLTKAMYDGAIEETHIPENALDVLAQHIVSETTMREWDLRELYALVRQSYNFRDLTFPVYKRTVEMLAGRINGSVLKALYPRLTWDIVNNKLFAPNSSRMNAVMNGGTIPDRAYYGVYLKNDNVKLGEMEEEFVWESRVGHAFYLGNNEYRIEEIHDDRIIVSSFKDVKPRPPFWKGDLLYRDFETSEYIGQFREMLVSRLDQPDVETEAWLEQNYHCDTATARNIIQYFKQDRSQSSTIAGAQTVIAEWFHDFGGEPLCLIRTSFGARINGLMALVLTGLLEEMYKMEIQYTYDDDALLFRLLNVDAFPDLERLLKKDAHSVKRVLFEKLIDSPVFSTYFRYNAARSLILTRSKPRQRIPLWLQRLRSADLLQAVRGIANFPLIAETYRECLTDVFDWDGLKMVLEKIRQGRIHLNVCEPEKPSPVAAGILFKLISNNMYEADRSHNTGDGGFNLTEMLADLLKSSSIPQVVSREQNDLLECRLQFSASDYKLKNVEELFTFIENNGPIETELLQPKCSGPFEKWLDELQKSGRIFPTGTTLTGWITPHIKENLAHPDNYKNQHFLMLRYLQNHAALTLKQIFKETGFNESDAINALEKLKFEEKVVSGLLLKDDNQVYWCERFNFARLYRQAIAERRQYQAPAENTLILPFLLFWQYVTRSVYNPSILLEMFQGYATNAGLRLREIFQARTESSGEENVLEQAIEDGKIILSFGGTPNLLQETFYLRGSKNYFPQLQPESVLSKEALSIRQFLRENGASLLDDIVLATELKPSHARNALRELLLNGSVSANDLNALDTLLGLSDGNEEAVIPSGWDKVVQRKTRRRGRYEMMQTFRTTQRLRKAHWFLLDSFSVNGRKRDPAEIAIYQARLLLKRYGVVVKEWYRHESGLLPWFDIFQALKRLEWQGEIVRGYFIQGLSGIQFALPEAVNILKQLQEKNTATHIPKEVCAVDPSVPFGGNLAWNLATHGGAELKVTRRKNNYLLIVNNIPIAYFEQYPRKIFFCQNWHNASIEALINRLKTRLKDQNNLTYRKMEIETINGQVAAQSPWATVFVEHGFERSSEKLILWPSDV